MSVIFDCDWEDGSDEQNTGGTHVWDDLQDENNRLSFDESSAMWDTNCLKQDGQLSRNACVVEDIAEDEFGVRIGYMYTYSNLADGQHEYFFFVYDIGTSSILFRLRNDSGTFSIQGFIRRPNNNIQEIGGVDISPSTKYQIVIKWKRNTAGGCSFKVFAEDGETLVGSEQTLNGAYSTRDTTLTTAQLGGVSSGSYLNHTMYYDIVQFLDTYAYPDTIQAGGEEYTLVADHGSFSLAGQSVTLKTARKLAASAGLFSLAGQDIGLKASRNLIASHGAFSLAGQDVGLVRAAKLLADYGGFILSGQDADLIYSGGAYVLVADAGVFSLSGQSVVLKAARKIAVEHGSFVLAGQDAGLKAARKLLADVGSFALTGQGVDFIRALKLLADYGKFTLSGQDASLIYSGSAMFPIWGLILNRVIKEEI